MPGPDGKLTPEEFDRMFPAAQKALESIPPINPQWYAAQEFARVQGEMARMAKAETTVPAPGQKPTWEKVSNDPSRCPQCGNDSVYWLTNTLTLLNGKRDFEVIWTCYECGARYPVRYTPVAVGQ